MKTDMEHEHEHEPQANTTLTSLADEMTTESEHEGPAPYKKTEGKEPIWDIHHDGAWSEFPPEDDCMIEWIYTIDLDRDAFTVDWMAHFNMTHWPIDWEDHVVCDNKGRRCVPTKLNKKFLVTDIFAEPPPIDEELIECYDELAPEIVEPPEPTNRFKVSLLLQLQRELTCLSEAPYDVVSKEWTIHDLQMQKFVYCVVKFSCWEAIEFHLEEPEKGENWDRQIPGLLKSAEYPRGTEYFVTAGSGDKQVLISLCTHLDNEEVMKMAVAKVAQMVEEGEMLTACIMSLNDIVIVTVDQTNESMKVTHTKPLPLFGDDFEGRRSLIAIMSTPDIKVETIIGPAKDTSVDEVDRMFQSLALSHGGHTNEPDFGCACKDAANVVRERTIRFPERTLLTHETWLKGTLYGIDDDGSIGLYSISEEQYPVMFESKEVSVKDYLALVDGADFGIGKLKLVPINVDRVLNPVVQEVPKEKKSLFPAGFPEPMDVSHLFR